MTLINLLPWREELRCKRQRNFFILLAASVLVTIILLLLVYLYIVSLITVQEKHNHYLQFEIDLLEPNITEMSQLEEQRELLTMRMELMHNLQRGRLQIVHVLEELVNIMPSGVYLARVKRVDETVSLTGRAGSNTAVSTLMKNITNATWIGQPLLLEIKDEKTVGDFPNHFKVQLIFTEGEALDQPE